MKKNLLIICVLSSFLLLAGCFNHSVPPPGEAVMVFPHPYDNPIQYSINYKVQHHRKSIKEYF